jgi:serpin B
MLRYFGLLFALAIAANLAQGDNEFNRNSVNFASNLYQKIAEEKNNQNLIFSPFSIHTILGLVYLGAEGQTAREMVDGLQLTTPDKDVHSGLFKESLTVHENNPSVATANKVYLATGLELTEHFETVAKDDFYSDIENINFSKSQESAGIINNWVENKTNHKITDLIKTQDIDANTQMVLINTIHFKADWQTKFEKHLTTEQEFWTSLTESSNVDVMSTGLAYFKGFHCNTLRVNAVRLPFKNMGLSMLVILPDERDGLSHLESGLTNENLLDLNAKIGDDFIFHKVKMPKFKIESSVDLGDTLSKMGMPTMFSENADFSGFLKSKQELKVSKVLHKAIIEANEDGVEAAAATAVTAVRMSAVRLSELPREFIADHPFFFAIMGDNGVLFAGRVINP